MDERFSAAGLQKNPNKAGRGYKVIRERIDKYRKDRPGGCLVREAPKEDLD